MTDVLRKALEPFAAIKMGDDADCLTEIVPNGYSDPQAWRNHIKQARAALTQPEPAVQQARPNPWRDRRGYCNQCRYLVCQCGPAQQPNGLPADVVALVIAAREAWEENCVSGDPLDKALEPFASRVPYEDQPNA